MKDDQEGRNVVGSTAGELKQLLNASELLNSIGQSILLARIKVGMLSSPLLPYEFEALAGEARFLLDQAACETNALSRELCPPLLAEAGLATALEWLVRQMATDCGLQVQLVASGNEKGLAVVRGAVVYQAARELLINVVKHAKCGTARLSVNWERDRLCLEVEDRGMGFDPAVAEAENGNCGCFGLTSIRQSVRRLGGAMKIVSVPGTGTQVAITVPLSGGEEI